MIQEALQLLSPLKMSESTGVPGWPRTQWGGGFRVERRVQSGDPICHIPHRRVLRIPASDTSHICLPICRWEPSCQEGSSKCIKNGNGPTKGYGPIVASGPWLLLRVNNPSHKKVSFPLLLSVFPASLFSVTDQNSGSAISSLHLFQGPTLAPAAAQSPSSPIRNAHQVPGPSSSHRDAGNICSMQADHARGLPSVPVCADTAIVPSPSLALG